MIIRTTAALAILITLVQADNSTKKLGAKGKKPRANPEATGFSVDDAVNSSPWQPGTPPLTLLRLLGIPQSLDSREPSNRRPPPPRLLPRFLPPINLTKTNRSSLSPFFGGFSPPEVGRQPSSGEDALRGSLRVQPVNLTSNASSVSGKPPQVHDSPRMPRLQITPSGRHRWRSADNDVTSSANDVTATTGNTTTDERRHNGDISTTSKTSLSATPPRASHDVNNDSFTSAPEVDNKDDGMHGKNAYDYYSGSDDNETHGKDPFHFAEHGQRLPPVWPPIPRHHMTIYPPPGDQQQQRPFGSASFDVFPGHHPMYGPLPVNTAVGQTLGEVNGQSSDSWTTGGGGAPNNNEALHVLSLAAVNHGDGVRTSTNWELGGRREPAGGLNVEGERTTKTSTSQPGSTSADQTARDTAASPNVASDAGHRPTSGDDSTTMSSSSLRPVKTTRGGGGDGNARGSISFWSPASWTRSAGIALTPTTLQFIGSFVLVSLAVVR